MDSPQQGQAGGGCLHSLAFVGSSASVPFPGCLPRTMGCRTRDP